MSLTVSIDTINFTDSKASACSKIWNSKITTAVKADALIDSISFNFSVLTLDHTILYT